MYFSTKKSTAEQIFHSFKCGCMHGVSLNPLRANPDGRRCNETWSEYDSFVQSSSTVKTSVWIETSGADVRRSCRREVVARQVGP